MVVSIRLNLSPAGWSGKGVVRNYGDVNQMSVDPLPSLYNRTLGEYRYIFLFG